MRHGKVEMVLSTSAPVRLVVQGHSRRSPQVSKACIALLLPACDSRAFHVWGTARKMSLPMWECARRCGGCGRTARRCRESTLRVRPIDPFGPSLCYAWGGQQVATAAEVRVGVCFQ